MNSIGKSSLWVVILLLGGLTVFSHATEPLVNEMAVHFLENQGQIDGPVAYYVQGKDKTLYFTPQGMTLALLDQVNKPEIRWSVKLSFEGTANETIPMGMDPKKAVFSYFKGKQENWKQGVASYGKLIYRDLWPGIDLVYTGTVNCLKYEFIVKPGADPNQIRLRYDGVTRAALTPSGALELTTPLGRIVDAVPIAYQQANTGRAAVNMAYALDEKQEDGSYSYGFSVGDYDHNKLLVLDPAIVVGSGFLGGSNYDWGEAIAVDSSGNIYLTGEVVSTEASFPVVAGPDLSFNGGSIYGDAFVAKVSADGSTLEYCGYIGGNSEDIGRAIEVDAAGCAYITGSAGSTESSFPVTVGPDLIANGNMDTFVAKVSADGTHLVYCGFVGGTEYDEGFDIAVSATGEAYITGSTSSDALSFPVTVGPDLTYGGGYIGDGYIAKVKADGTGLLYCGYIGGSGGDSSRGVAVDSSDNVYLVGFTSTIQTDFPVTMGPDLTINGSFDVFVAKLNADGTTYQYCGYLGGSKADCGMAIAIDASGRAYLTGYTESDRHTFPAVVGPSLHYIDNTDAFVARINAAGTEIEYCGYIGGYGVDRAYDIGVDNKNNAYVLGETGNATGFPAVEAPGLEYTRGIDTFVARVDDDGSHLDYCGFIGGDFTDWSGGLAVDSQGTAYVTGTAGSTEASFPVGGMPDVSHNGAYDIFLTKISFFSLLADRDTLSVATGGSVGFSLQAGAENGGRQYLMLGSFHGSMPGIPLPNGGDTLPINFDNLTSYILSRLNGPIFIDFLGMLNGAGEGAAQLSVGPINPSKIGKIMTYAYCLEGNPHWDVVSNPVEITFVP